MTEAAATYAGTKVTWRLKDYAQVWAHGDEVRVRWSDRLALVLKCASEEQAQRTVLRVLKAGRITPERWSKVFYPGEEYDLAQILTTPERYEFVSIN